MKYELKFFFLVPLLCGVNVRRYTPPCSTVVHFLPLVFDVTSHSFQPSSLRSSYLPPTLYFNFHCPPSYILLHSLHHVPTTSASSSVFSTRFLPLSLSPLFSYFLSCHALYLCTFTVTIKFLGSPIYFPVSSSMSMSLPRTPLLVCVLSTIHSQTHSVSLQFILQHLAKGVCKVKKFQKSKTNLDRDPPIPHPFFFFLKPITDMDRTLKS